MIVLDGKSKAMAPRPRGGAQALRAEEHPGGQARGSVAAGPCHETDSAIGRRHAIRLLAINGNPILLRELAQSADVTLCVMGEPHVIDPLRGLSSSSRMFPYSPARKLNLHVIRSVRRAIRQVRPDVVHTFASRSLTHAVLATTAMRDPPPIIGYRGVIAPISRWDPGHRISLLHRRTRAIICASDAVRQSLMDSGIAPDRCHTIRNPLDIPNVPGRSRARRAEWGIPAGALVVGTVAAMRPIKRIDLMLQAAIECADLRDMYWLLIGPIQDPRVQRLVGDARIRDRVRVLGFQPDARNLIGAADILVMTSEMEGLSRALLEAMAQQICPVVTNVGGTAEAVRHGLDGLLFPRGDVGALVRHLRYLHANRSEIAVLARSARRRAEQLFSPAACTRHFIELYRTILEPSSISGA